MKLKNAFLIIMVIGLFFTFCVSNVSAIKDSDIMGETYNNYENNTVSCGTNSKTRIENGEQIEYKGEALLYNIPKSVVKITHLVYLGILIALPILLIIFGMLDLFKGITAQKEDDIRKGQQMFVKRLISAAIVFFAFLIIKLVIGFASSKENAGRIIQCAECFIDNNCD